MKQNIRKEKKPYQAGNQSRLNMLIIKKTTQVPQNRVPINSASFSLAASVFSAEHKG